MVLFAGAPSSSAVARAERAETNDFVIVPTDPVTGKRLPAVVRIGPFHYFGSPGGYRGAVKAFGLPSSKGTDSPESNLCTVRWRSLGLDIGFASAVPGCAARNLARSAWYGMTIHSARWRTDRGLRVGDGESRMRRLYPRAIFHDKPPAAPYWSLVRENQEEFGNVDILQAQVWQGRVAAIVVPAAYIY